MAKGVYKFETKQLSTDLFKCQVYKTYGFTSMYKGYTCGSTKEEAELKAKDAVEGNGTLF